MADRTMEVLARLGTRFEVRALNIADRIDVRGIEPRLGQNLPVMIEVAPAGCAVLLRGGAVVLFGIDPIQQERFIQDLGTRAIDRYPKYETERAIVRVGDADAIEPDAIVIREVTCERLQVIAEILGKSVILARNELELGDEFRAIEPLAHKLAEAPRRLPWKQRELVAHIGNAILVEHELVGAAEVLEKPELLWDKPDLDRFYGRLEDEYEIRERHLALERRLAVVTSAARTMLDLSQTRRSLMLEYYVVALFVLEVALGIYQLLVRAR